MINQESYSLFVQNKKKKHKIILRPYGLGIVSMLFRYFLADCCLLLILLIALEITRLLVITITSTLFLQVYIRQSSITCIWF